MVDSATSNSMGVMTVMVGIGNLHLNMGSETQGYSKSFIFARGYGFSM
jgi:hypothetical protein